MQRKDNQMLSKMAQPNNVGGGSGSAAAGGRRVPLSLSGVAVGGSTTVSRLQQAATGNGRSKSPQNSNVSKKGEHLSGPFIKKGNANQQRSSAPTASSGSSSSSVSSKPHDDEKKKGQNGVNKSTNGNQKLPQNNGGTTVAAAVVQEQKQQQQTKEKVQEKKETPRTEVKAEEKPSDKEESETEAKRLVESKKNKASVSEVIDLDVDEPEMDVAPPTTPTSERKSSRRAAAAAATNSPVSASAPAAITPKKTPNKAVADESPSQRKQQHNKAEAEQQSEMKLQEEKEVKDEKPATTTDVAAVEDVEMEALTVDASPIRSTVQQNNAQPAATSTPGRNLFGFRSNSKQINEVELAAQLSNSPASAPPARTFAQISGRRSIRPTTGLTPGKMGSYRCVNTSELDTSGLTNTSMNATVGSEIPNTSSFSFSFFGRGRKRERTPPPLSASQSANDLAQDVEMSPPKRARFELFSLNLASPFSLLRSRFSKATINSPSARQRLDLTPPNGEETEEVGEVQNVSGVVNQDEEEQELNKSSTASNEVNEVAQEAGLETPKKAGTPENEVMVEDGDKKDKLEGGKDIDDAVAAAAADDLPTTDAAEAVEESSSYGDGTNRSRCAIM